MVFKLLILLLVVIFIIACGKDKKYTYKLTVSKNTKVSVTNKDYSNLISFNNIGEIHEIEGTFNSSTSENIIKPTEKDIKVLEKCLNTVYDDISIADIVKYMDSQSKGHKVKIEIPMEEAYGDYDEELVEELTKADFADFDDIYEGMEFVVELEDGTEMIAVITEIDGDKVYTDSNHPFSGRNLLFEVEVADVREATDEELDHGHVHFHGFEDEEE